MIKEVDSTIVEDNSEVDKAIEQNGAEKEEYENDDGEWNKKGQDDADHKLPNKGEFSNEEVD